MNENFDVIIIGEGIAGLFCAAQLRDSGLQIATLEGEFFGGLVTNVNELDEFDAGQGASGLDYASRLAAANRKAGVKSIMATVQAIHRRPQGFEVETDSATYSSRHVVMATGARPKRLDVPGEEHYHGRGVSDCADCDAPLYEGSDVIVTGNGTWALKDALLLAQSCKTVHLVYSDTALDAPDLYTQRVQDNANIHCHAGKTVSAIVGSDDGMTGVILLDDDGIEQTLDAEGLFVRIGHVPGTDSAPADIAKAEDGSLTVNENLETSIPGIWAIGLVRTGFPGWLKDAQADASHVAEQLKQAHQAT